MNNFENRERETVVSSEFMDQAPAGMADDTATGPVGDSPTGSASTGGPSTAGASSPDVHLSDEFREFGRQFEALLRAARYSPRAKEIESQLTAAWRDVERGVNSTITTVKDRSPEVKDSLAGVATTAVDEIQVGLARGLRNLNLWMAKTIRESEQARVTREENIGREAAAGTADNEVADRFSSATGGTGEPVFGEGLSVPSPQVDASPGSAPAEGVDAGGTAETLVTDRFDDNPVRFGDADQLGSTGEPK
jgi:hypothetical protein